MDTTDLCDLSYHDPGICENAVTQVDSSTEEPIIIWLLAAFPEGADPGVSGIGCCLAYGGESKRGCRRVRLLRTFRKNHHQ